MPSKFSLLIRLVSICTFLIITSVTQSAQAQSANEQASTLMYDQFSNAEVKEIQKKIAEIDALITGKIDSALQTSKIQPIHMQCSHPNGCSRYCPTGGCICYGTDNGGCFCSSC